MSELEIGQGDIGDNQIGGPVVIFDGDVKDVGKLTLSQITSEIYELTINGKKIKLIGSRKVGHA